MKRLLSTLAIVGLALTVPTQAQAVFIVDTGTPTNFVSRSLRNQSTGQQFLAGQFTTSQNYTINSLEGFIRADLGGTASTGMLDAVLYLDNVGSVDPVGEIFRAAFNIPTPSQPLDFDWRGVYGLNLNLNAGTYWLAFEAADGSEVSSAMADMVTNPMDQYAFNGGTGWINLTTSPGNFDLGMRIDATAQSSNAVPEPATMALFATGLIGAGLRRKVKA